MNRIDRAFAERAGPAFIGFLVAGDPDPETSAMAAKALIDAGVDLLELGIPFSDPMADGPTIQRAHDRALKAGTRLETVFALVREIRGYSNVPIVLFTYFNPVYRRGAERFVREARRAGADGLLIVDLPLEESEEIGRMLEAQEMDRILLIAPTTSPERRRSILNRASGFVYVVAVEGVTGAREHLPEHLTGLIASLRQETHVPLAVGFGVSRPGHVRAIATAGADAVVVGSAIVRLVEEHCDDREEMVRALRAYAAEMAGDT